MRIAMVGYFPPVPDRFGGGVEASTWGLLSGLQKFPEAEVHLVTLDQDAKQPYRRVWADATVHYLPSPRRLLTTTRYLVPRRRVLAALQQIQPDVVHSQNSQMYGDICLSSGFPCVVSVHGIVREELRHVSEASGRLRRKLQMRVQERVVARAQHLIQPTAFPEQYFGSLATGTWHTIWNPIAEEFFEAAPKPEQGRILFAGALIPRKRPNELLEALAQIRSDVPSVTLVLAGGAPDAEYEASLRELATRLGIADRVDFLGLVDRSQLIAELERANVLALPSGQETSPMVIGEAMAAGVPVVASRVGGVASLVNDGVTGLTYDGLGGAPLASALRTALSDLDLSTRMARASREIAGARFRPEAVAGRLLAIYEEVISNHE